MREIGLTILLLTLSNVFMTFAWYAHLKELGSKPWLIAALVSWGIAFFEYLLQVPANRIGYGVLSLGQLKNLHGHAAEDHAGSDHAVGVCSIRRAVHEGAIEARLSVGGAVPARCGIFHVPRRTGAQVK